MRKLLISLIVITFFSLAINAQTVFRKVYPNIYESSCIKHTNDGGFIIAGATKSSSVNSDAFLLKTDANANIIWRKTFGGNYYDNFLSVQQTTDGGYIAAGTISDSSDSDIFLVRIDSSGDTLWAKSYGGSSYDTGNEVNQTSDGGFIIAGSTYSFGSDCNGYLIKTDSNGNILWTKTFDTDGYGFANNMQNTSDGGFIITGTSQYTYGRGIYVIKTDSIGDTLWTRSIIDPNFWDYQLMGKSVVQTSDGGFIVLGNTDYASPLGGKSKIIKLNPNGDTTWTKTFGFPGGYNYLNSLCQTQDGGFVIAGSALSGDFLANGVLALLIKIDMNGDTLWTKKYGYKAQYNGSESYIENVKQTNDGGFILVGYTDSWGGGTYLLKTDSLGNSTCSDGFADNFNLVNFPVIVFSGSSIGTGGVEYNALVTIGIPDSTFINPCLPIPDICMVTVDSVSQKNMVIWEKNIDTTFVDSYNIYRETTSSGVYLKIGNIPNSSLSTFIDYTSNPPQKANRYKITTLDSNGIESYNKSTAHKTIHLSVNTGLPPQINLIWDNYEGFAVSTFRIWRGNASGMNIIDSIAGNMFSYTDLTPPANDTIYFIEAVNPSGVCIPTVKSHLSTISNFVNTKNPFGIFEHFTNSTFIIYPNPATDKLTIETLQKTNIEISNIQGQIMKIIVAGDNKTNIDVTDLFSGVYIVKVKTEKGVAVKKFIKK